MSPFFIWLFGRFLAMSPFIRQISLITCKRPINQKTDSFFQWHLSLVFLAKRPIKIGDTSKKRPSIQIKNVDIAKKRPCDRFLEGFAVFYLVVWPFQLIFNETWHWKKQAFFIEKTGMWPFFGWLAVFKMKSERALKDGDIAKKRPDSQIKNGDPSKKRPSVQRKKGAWPFLAMSPFLFG